MDNWTTQTKWPSGQTTTCTHPSWTWAACRCRSPQRCTCPGNLTYIRECSESKADELRFRARTWTLSAVVLGHRKNKEFPYNTIRDKSQNTPCTRVDDVGEVELEVAGAAGADVDGAAGAEALRAAAEDEAAAGVTLRPADTHALGSGYIMTLFTIPIFGCSHLGVADRALVVREVGHLEHIEHLAPAPRAVVGPQAVPRPQHQYNHHQQQQKHGLGVGSGVVFVQIIRKKSQMSQNCSNWHKKRCPVSPLPRCGAEWWCHISCCMRGRHVSDVRPCPEQRVHFSEETTIINMPQFCVKTNGMLPVLRGFKKCLVLGTFFDVNRRTSATCSGQPAWSQGSGRSYGILIYQAYNITRGRGQNVALFNTSSTNINIFKIRMARILCLKLTWGGFGTHLTHYISLHPVMFWLHLLCTDALYMVLKNIL